MECHAQLTIRRHAWKAFTVPIPLAPEKQTCLANLAHDFTFEMNIWYRKLFFLHRKWNLVCEKTVIAYFDSFFGNIICDIFPLLLLPAESDTRTVNRDMQI